MNTTTDQLLRNELELLVENGGDLEKTVAAEALEYDDVSDFFNDLQKHGCISGMVSSLIYYEDTHQFYDTHYDEIERLRYDFEQMTSSPLHIQGDLKNYLAWFAFEEKAYQIRNMVECKIEGGL